ncbi:MAG: 30S ribosomal protein S16 [Patescibacteria group bacterium]
MLRIRFSRTGKVGQPSFRIVVAENRAPVKGRYLEMVGHYMSARKPKVMELKKERITYWISKGAIPTDTAAALFKKEGMPNMEKYLRPRNRARKVKGEEVAEATAAPAKAAPPVATPAPAAEKSPA